MYFPAKNSIKKIAAKVSFARDFLDFKKMNDGRFAVEWNQRFPCLNENTQNTSFDAHYIYHPAWAARILSQTRPEFHVDISSTLTFCSIVSAFLPVKFYDFRPASINLKNLTCGQKDLTKLSFETGGVKSLSCMHTLEHIGLGRYGDPIDPAADVKAAKELGRVLAVGGEFLFVVPVGKPKLMFNAHRIYSFEQAMGLFPGLKLKEFALVKDDMSFVENATKEMTGAQNYGCGCFRFTK